MEFDKKTILAFILIGLILILIQTGFYQERFMPTPSQPKIVKPPESEELQAPVPESEEEGAGFAEQPSAAGVEFRAEEEAISFQQDKGEEISVRTKLYDAVFSTQGATVRSWTLKKYLEADSSFVQLVGENGYGNLAVLLPTSRDTFDTSPYVFEVNKKAIDLDDEQPADSLTFTLDLGEYRKLVKTYVFYHDRYSIDLKVRMINLADFVDGFSYFLGWRSGLRSTEPDFNADMQSAKIYALQGDANSFEAGDSFDASEWDDPTDWVAIRTKYFTAAVIPEKEKAQGVHFFAEKVNVGKEEPWEKYGFNLQMPYDGRQKTGNAFTVYLGPLDYDIVKSYDVGLEMMMDFGWAIFRPFGKFVLFCFTWLHKIIPNYGVVIILFAILIKIVLYPLTKKSYQSMKEMQALQPMLQELNEKYKDNPQKKQQEMMRIYKEHGVNPLGGCIPMLLQMPLLIALFNVFQSTIELRGADFVWWIHDLSRPDTIATLPFSLPLYGDQVNILPLFMGVTMFVQQKMTMKDPKQKAMVYIMPVFFTLLFNSFPSGLNLYYALFNLFSIVQEKIIPYHPKKPEDIKPKKGMPVKKRRIKHDYRGRTYK